jgi:hypothetical protein
VERHRRMSTIVTNSRTPDETVAMMPILCSRN